MFSKLFGKFKKNNKLNGKASQSQALNPQDFSINDSSFKSIETKDLWSSKQAVHF